MTADQARAVTETLGQQIQQEWMTTVKVIEAIPEDKKSYKPDPKGRSAWELAVHLCLSDVWFLNGVLRQDFTPHGEEPPADTVKGLADWYKHEMPKALEHVLALEGPKLAVPVDFFGMKMPNATFWCGRPCTTRIIEVSSQPISGRWARKSRASTAGAPTNRSSPDRACKGAVTPAFSGEANKWAGSSC